MKVHQDKKNIFSYCLFKNVPIIDNKDLKLIFEKVKILFQCD